MAEPAAPVTLVVPVRNEAGSLEAFIRGIAGQTCPPARIVVSDGGSTDGSQAILRQWAAQDPRVTAIELDRGYPGRTRNAGALAVAGEWMAFADAGTTVPADWLARLVERRDRGDEPDVVYGSYEPELRTFAQRCGALSFVAPRQAVDGGYLRGPTTASMLIRKNALERAGGFPEDLRAAEDLVFFERIASGACRVAWAPKAVIEWQGPATFGGVFRRFRAFSDHTLRAGLGRTWHRSVVTFYALALVLLVLALLHHPAWAAVIAGGLAGRVARGVHARRPPFGPQISLSPSILGGVALTLLLVDAAMFAGMLDYARRT